VIRFPFIQELARPLTHDGTSMCRHGRIGQSRCSNHGNRATEKFRLPQFAHNHRHEDRVDDHRAQGLRMRSRALSRTGAFAGRAWDRARLQNSRQHRYCRRARQSSSKRRRRIERPACRCLGTDRPYCAVRATAVPSRGASAKWLVPRRRDLLPKSRKSYSAFKLLLAKSGRYDCIYSTKMEPRHGEVLR